MPKAFAYIISQYPEFHETFVAREVDALVEAGYDITIYSLKNCPKHCRNLYPHHNELVRYSPFLLSIPLLWANLISLFTRPKKYFGALLWLVRHYINSPLELVKAVAVFPKTAYFAHRIRKCDVALHAHWATIPTSMAVVVSCLNGSPFTFTGHAWDIYLSSPMQLAEKVALAEGIVTCTGYNVQYLRSICRPADLDKISLNYHGLDFNTIDEVTPGEKDGCFSIVAIGRLVEQKGFTYLIESLPQLNVEVCLTIIGDGPMEHELKRAAAKLPVTASVCFAGRLSHNDTLARVKASDVMVAPSVISKNGDRDGIPNVILEAMACGVPVVATNVSGIPEVVRHGTTGLLVNPADSTELAKALLKIHDDPVSASRMQVQARKHVELNFSSKKNIEEFIELLAGFATRKA